MVLGRPARHDGRLVRGPRRRLPLVRRARHPPRRADRRPAPRLAHPPHRRPRAPTTDPRRHPARHQRGAASRRDRADRRQPRQPLDGDGRRPPAARGGRLELRSFPAVCRHPHRTPPPRLDLARAAGRPREPVDRPGRDPERLLRTRHRRVPQSGPRPRPLDPPVAVLVPGSARLDLPRRRCSCSRCRRSTGSNGGRRTGSPSACSSPGLSLRFAWVGIEASGATSRYTIGVVAWWFLVGWAAVRADTPLRRWTVVVLTAVGTLGYFGDLGREALVIGGIALLVHVPALRVPRRLVTPVSTPGVGLAVHLPHALGRLPPPRGQCSGARPAALAGSRHRLLASDAAPPTPPGATGSPQRVLAMNVSATRDGAGLSAAHEAQSPACSSGDSSH